MSLTTQSGKETSPIKSDKNEIKPAGSNKNSTKDLQAPKDDVQKQKTSDKTEIKNDKKVTE